MSFTGFFKRCIGSVATAFVRLHPSGITGRLAFAGILSIVSVATASFADSTTLNMIAWLLCFASLLALVAVQRAATARFQRLCDSLESITLGEVSGRVDTILVGQSGPEVDSVREMNQALMDIVQQVRASAERIAATTRETAAGTQNLSYRTEEQAATNEEIASSMEQLSGTVRHNSENCQLASDLTCESATLADE